MPVPCAAAALEGILAQQPQQTVAKLATDIFKTFINPILQEQPELLKGMDPRKDMSAATHPRGYLARDTADALQVIPGQQ